jgi:hypothetical protein
MIDIYTTDLEKMTSILESSGLTDYTVEKNHELEQDPRETEARRLAFETKTGRSYDNAGYPDIKVEVIYLHINTNDGYTLMVFTPDGKLKQIVGDRDR